MTPFTEHGSIAREILNLMGPDSVAMIILALMLYSVATTPAALRTEPQFTE